MPCLSGGVRDTESVEFKKKKKKTAKKRLNNNVYYTRLADAVRTEHVRMRIFLFANADVMVCGR